MAPHNGSNSTRVGPSREAPKQGTTFGNKASHHGAAHEERSGRLKHAARKVLRVSREIPISMGRTCISDIPLTMAAKDVGPSVATHGKREQDLGSTQAGDVITLKPLLGTPVHGLGSGPIHTASGTTAQEGDVSLGRGLQLQA